MEMIKNQIVEVFIHKMTMVGYHNSQAAGNAMLNNQLVSQPLLQSQLSSASPSSKTST